MQMNSLNSNTFLGLQNTYIIIPSSSSIWDMLGYLL